MYLSHFVKFFQILFLIFLFLNVILSIFHSEAENLNKNVQIKFVKLSNTKQKIPEGTEKYCAFV